LQLAYSHDFADPQAFERLIARVARLDWVVYVKKPFRRSAHVLAYLGRYTHRIGIANSRLVAVDDHAVTFRTKAGKCVTLTPIEFLRRLVQHVLPEGLQKIRHYGLYASCNVRTLLQTAHGLLSSSARPTGSAPHSWQQQLRELTGRDVDTCPYCGARLEHFPVPAAARAPPHRAAA
jgi:hypothetical protein